MGAYFRPETTLVRPWHVLSLDDALRIRDAGALQLVPATWVPLLKFEGRPLLAVDSETGAVHVVDEGFPGPAPPQFQSIAELAATLVRLFDEELVNPDPEEPPLA